MTNSRFTYHNKRTIAVVVVVSEPSDGSSKPPADNKPQKYIVGAQESCQIDGRQGATGARVSTYPAAGKE